MAAPQVLDEGVAGDDHPRGAIPFEHMRTELVADALDTTASKCGGQTARIIFHGDRGSQHMSGEYHQGALRSKRPAR